MEDNHNFDFSGPIPNHVAIIMDGNGRWAIENNLTRSEGHREGMEAIRRVTRRANELNIKVLTLYAFSTENWKRPVSEIKYLMNLPIRFFDEFVPELMENNVKVQKIGFSNRVPLATARAINKAVEKTKDNQGMVLNFAFNYGSRAEIVESMKKIYKKINNNELKINEIDEDTISENLFTGQFEKYRDVDLLIRTSGEQRLSNFLLWQNAYSEFYFTKHYWPDFDSDLFDEALLNYKNRHRRFGGVNQL